MLFYLLSIIKDYSYQAQTTAEWPTSKMLSWYGDIEKATISKMKDAR